MEDGIALLPHVITTELCRFGQTHSELTWGSLEADTTGLAVARVSKLRFN